MVHQLQFRSGRRAPTVVTAVLAFSLMIGGALASVRAYADDESARGSEYLRQAHDLYREGKYFSSARYAFSAGEANPALKIESYSWVTLGLVKSRFYNAASFFFIKTLQEGDRNAIQRVLTQTHDLLVHLGPDLLKKYLIRHTRYEDYDAHNRSAYLYALGKDTLLRGDEERAISYLNGMSRKSSLWPFALLLRGTALSIQGKNDAAIEDYDQCVDIAGSDKQDEDLKARCVAGKARTLYQMDRFNEADWVYDQIPKSSFVWPEILFEQAWNSFGKAEYNRSLGKLVSYKSPSLRYVFNTEVDVLRAQSYLALCLYSDANEVINEFNSKYAKTGEYVKKFVEKNASDLPTFYELGKNAYMAPLHSPNDTYRMMNRFIRSPYFQNLVRSERLLGPELVQIRRFAAKEKGGFPGFLEKVLQWRLKSIRLLGGTFVKNSLIDYHAALISDFEKMAFIKLEMLGRAKEKLLITRPIASADRSRGNVEPERRDDQYQWGFNGEFWIDELGDYVFGLESECASSNGSRS